MISEIGLHFRRSRPDKSLEDISPAIDAALTAMRSRLNGSSLFLLVHASYIAFTLLLLRHTCISRVLIERREKCEFYCRLPPARQIGAVPMRFGMNEPGEREGKSGELCNEGLANA